jgi:precorrin-6x reductase
VSDAPQVDLNGLIVELVRLREAKKAAKKAVEDIEEAQEKVKLRYRQALESLGIREAQNVTHSAAITEVTVPQVKSWEALYDYIHANKYYHLLQRRPSTTGCEELFAQGIEIPGVEKFTKVDISLRSK